MLKLKLQYFGHLMWRTDSLENTLMLGKIEGRRRKGTTKDEIVGWHHRLYGHEFEQALGVDGQGSLACCSHGVTKSRTRLSEWTELNTQNWSETLRKWGEGIWKSWQLDLSGEMIGKTMWVKNELAKSRDLLLAARFRDAARMVGTISNARLTHVFKSWQYHLLDGGP